MPTIRGWVVAAVGGTTLAVGRIFGTIAVQQLGFGLIALVAISAAVVLLGRHELRVTRRVAPMRARAGQPVALTLDITNHGRGSAPLILLEDRLPAGIAGTARFALSGIEPSGKRSATITLRAPQRGLYQIGPLEASFVDPFGLARARSLLSARTALLVHPRIDPLVLPRDLGERRSVATSALRQPTASRGEDFYTLREYVEGDDLRKIHWGSTAKRGRYMIRQEETPWHTRATIVLDDRGAVHDGIGRSTSFERAVEAAASLVDLYQRSGYSYRLVTANQRGFESNKGHAHFTRCLDLLATIDPSPDGREAMLARLAELDRSTSAEAALVLVTGTLTTDVAVAVARLHRRFRQVAVVSFPAHRFGAAPTKTRWRGESEIVEANRLLERSGVRTLALGPDEPLATAWSAGSQRPATRRTGWEAKPELV